MLQRIDWVRRRLVAACAAGALTVSCATAVAAESLTEWIAFDRVYIPALALTSQNKAQEAERAMQRLEAAWPAARARMLARGGAVWQQASQAVDAAIGEAAGRVAAKKLAEAHESLESVRVALKQAREASGIDYLPDRMTAFHDAMERAVLQGQKGAGGMDADAVQAAATEASGLWRRVVDAPETLGMDSLAAPKRAQARELVEAETRSLRALEQALASGDRDAIARAAVAIKPNFAKLYILFGDMPRSG